MFVGIKRAYCTTLIPVSRMIYSCISLLFRIHIENYRVFYGLILGFMEHISLDIVVLVINFEWVSYKFKASHLLNRLFLHLCAIHRSIMCLLNATFLCNMYFRVTPPSFRNLYSAGCFSQNSANDSTIHVKRDPFWNLSWSDQGPLTFMLCFVEWSVTTVDYESDPRNYGDVANMGVFRLNSMEVPEQVTLPNDPTSQHGSFWVWFLEQEYHWMWF